VKLLLDGDPLQLEGSPDAILCDVARRAGARRLVRGCDDGRCGACRALLDGELVATCRVRLGDVRDGAALTTAASLDDTPPARAALLAFADERPTRCKMCVGGLSVTAWVLARDVARGAELEARREALLAEATCMCTGRGSWRRALGR
jgi:aerobic-type carbon monoxide dehydrogenase small subunit (CoxS/CutS family)